MNRRMRSPPIRPAALDGAAVVPASRNGTRRVDTGLCKTDNNHRLRQPGDHS